MNIIRKIKQWKRALQKRALQKRMNRINPNPVIYRKWEHTTWGDHIKWNNIDKMQIVGWLFPRPRNGDKLIYECESGKYACGYIVNVEYCNDPRDMFFADVIPFGYVDKDYGK